MVTKKPLAEKHQLRQISLSPEVNAYLDAMQSGTRSEYIEGLIRKDMERKAKRKAARGDKP